MWSGIVKIIIHIYSNPLFLNWLTLLIAIITLVIVFFQTIYTKGALKEAQKSIKIATTSRQLELLPRIDYIIFVRTYLENWIEELNKVAEDLKNNNEDGIKKRAQRKVRAKGLLDEYFYKEMPNWLSVIYSTGVQYYYNSSCLYEYLWDDKKKQISNSEHYLERFDESIYYLNSLLKYIINEIPDVFLNCPASKNLNDFISNNK